MLSESLNSKLTLQGVFLLGKIDDTKQFECLFTEGCLLFVAELHRKFENERKRLMSARYHKLNQIQQGKLFPCFNPSTREIRNSFWQIDGVPECLKVRKVDVVCLDVANKTVLDQCMTSNADGIQVDFDDGFSPTWDNVILSQVNLYFGVRESFHSKKSPLLIVRPRSLHLPESHMVVDGESVCGAFFDFGVFWYHNAKILSENSRGPFFYLPKIEGYEESKLWNVIFEFSQQRFEIPIGTAKAIVLIEHILAVFEMDEILFYLRHHVIGLNTGKFDYVASYIRTFSKDKNFVLPERSTLGTNQEFLATYNSLLINTCHRRKAHATGGMANIPTFNIDESKQKLQIKSVFEGKLAEAKLGFDGALVASIDFIDPCRRAFDEVIGSSVPHQISNFKAFSKHPSSIELEDYFANSLLKIPCGEITLNGLFQAVQVSLFYIEAWIRGEGTIILDGVVEDLATAEICRSLLWQWVKYNKKTTSGEDITKQYLELVVQKLVDEKILSSSIGKTDENIVRHWKKVTRLFFVMLNSENFLDFMPNFLYQFITKIDVPSKL